MEPVEKHALITKTELESLTYEIKRLQDQLTLYRNKLVEASYKLAGSDAESNMLAKRLHEADDTLAEIDEQLTATNKKEKIIEEVMCSKFNQIVEDHEKQLDLRIELLDQQYAKMQDVADEHQKLFTEECMIAQQLQEGCIEKNKLLASLQNLLAEAKIQISESDDEKNKLAKMLDKANDRLAESDAEKKQLTERLYEANHRLVESALELQTHRKRASITKLRQLKELKELADTEEMSALIHCLKKDTETKEVGRNKTQDMMCKNVGAAQRTGDVNKLDDKGSTFNDYLQRLKEIYQPLLEKLEPKKVAAYMYQYDALTIKELQSVQHSHKTHCEASEELLKIILEVKEQHVYNCFLDALRDTNQQHIWSWLSFNDYDIDGEHAQLIQKHYSFIVKSMDTQTSGLIAVLYARGIIDERDKDDIESETRSIERNEKLLSYLGRKTKDQFIRFLDAMSKTGQGHIAKKLSGDVNVQESQLPTLKHVIPSDGRRVIGLTLINNNLFVLRKPSKGEIQVYETLTFTQHRTVRVAGLIDSHSWCSTLTSCDVNNCLIVCDDCNIHIVNLSTKIAHNWQVDGKPVGLSVNNTRHVIVTCNLGNEIREYTRTGKLIHTIKLQKSHVFAPWHAVQLTESNFIVSHWGPVHGVSLVDAEGSVIATYRNSESTKLLNGPLQMTLVKNGSVLVVDSGNNRLVVLDASLKNARELTLPIDVRLNQPRCVYINESISQLYVGEEGSQRVVLCDKISVE